jgi:hypothetical protein
VTQVRFALLALPAVLLLAGSASAKGPKLVWPVPNPTLQDPSFVPTSNNRQISGVFGPRLKWGGARYDHHEGLDFYAQYDPQYPRGDHPVLSIMNGVVSELILPSSPERTETGNKVVITHDVPWTAFGGKKDWGNVITAYLHLSSVSVSKGQAVKAGAEIGRAGETGYTSTVHLHFNAYRAGGRLVHVNPARLFSPKRFKGVVLPVAKQTVEVDWIERNQAAGTALVRVLLAHNVYTLDGFVFAADKDDSRAVSFEHVSAEMRPQRDTGDQGLFPNLRLFPLRYNGGGDVARVNERQPRGWPAGTHRVEMGKGVRLGFDLLATGLPEKVKTFKLTVFGVAKDKVTAKCKGFRKLIPAD